MLAWTQFHTLEAPAALEKAGAVLQAVINRTVAVDSAKTIGGERVPPELRLIECKRVIEEPLVSFRCQLVEPLALKGVVFDMDGTLTLPGQLDFQRMRERTGVPPGADIVPFLRERHAGNAAAL